MRVLLSDADRFPFSADDRAVLRSAGLELVELAGHDPGELAVAGRDVAAIFVYHASLDEALLERLQSCRLVARCGTGYDKIDVAAARRRGMEVTYVPDYGAVDVAEHTIALLLAAARRLSTGIAGVRAGRWPSYSELGPMRRVAGRRLGLLGFGRIAREVAVRAKGIGLVVLACDPFVSPEIAVGAGVELVELDALVASSDYLSVHLPLTAATRRLVDRRLLALLPEGACLVNTSRGAVLDEEALAEALESGHLAAASLDVLEREPPLAGNRILALPQVLVTPHSAAFTEEALAEVRSTAIADAVAVLGGAAPRHPVP